MEEESRKKYINVDFFEDLTGEIAPPAQAGVEEIGTRIAKLRKEKGLSLDELSNMTGFAVDLLSDIEQKQVQPQLGTVIKLSKALDSAFGRLVSGSGDRLYSEEVAVGVVTSGTACPYWETDANGELTGETKRRSIGLALVDSSIAPGTVLEADSRGRRLSAKTVKRHGTGRKPPYFRPLIA